MHDDDDDGGGDGGRDGFSLTRRTFVGSILASVPAIAFRHADTAEAATVSATETAARAQAGRTTVRCAMTINGTRQQFDLDPRVTLLDLVRERLALTGTKKGCDHGQCGACTVIVNGRRINSCLSLAVAHDGDAITTIEGLGGPDHLHAMQAAFLEHDGFQCGYCTPGQICSAVAVLEEARAGDASAVTADLARGGPIELSDEEIRERMSGNICRCGAYPNIVAAVQDAAGKRGGRT
jgi:xanthine dehydrogenase YagT iron-sulfur-binding subunit